MSRPFFIMALATFAAVALVAAGMRTGIQRSENVTAKEPTRSSNYIIACVDYAFDKPGDTSAFHEVARFSPRIDGQCHWEDRELVGER